MKEFLWDYIFQKVFFFKTSEKIIYIYIYILNLSIENGSTDDLKSDSKRL